MRDDLLARADRAIRESQLVREWAHQDRLNAGKAVAQARATVRLARAEGERSVSLYREMASQAVALRKNKPIGCLSPNTDLHTERRAMTRLAARLQLQCPNSARIGVFSLNNLEELAQGRVGECRGSAFAR